MPVVWTRAALAEILRIYDYLYGFNPRAAARVAASLRKEAERLAEFPQLGRRVRNTDMRELVAAYPYIIRYRVTKNDVVILRIRHSSRRPTTP